MPDIEKLYLSKIAYIVLQSKVFLILHNLFPASLHSKTFC